MKKFKDFLYDKNDILIAVLILIVAAILILWRLNAIMDYPKTLIDDNITIADPARNPDDSGDKGSDEPSRDDGQSTDKDNGDKSDDGSSKDNDDKSSDSDKNTNSLWADGALSRDVEVSIYGDTASSAIECLVNAGLFKNYAEYQSVCDSAGLDHQKVKAGTFTFKKGSTKSDIARTVNWS